MKKILILIFHSFLISNAYTQDTTYIDFFVDEKRIDFDNKIEFEIKTNDSIYKISIIDNEFFIVPQELNTNFNFIIRYKNYELNFFVKSLNVFNYRIKFIIENYPILNYSKKIFFNKKNKFI